MSDNYNPDVLSCLANLSSDEVFTPPEIANQMLDLLPQELFTNPETKFLDPFTKSGVFLREIAKRLIVGLEDKIPNLEDRIEHIFKNQLYGIAITELTSLLSRRSLYCSKYSNSKYSVAKFDNIEGNIRFKRIDHTWKNNKCIWCSASKENLGDRNNLETHAYEFIHTSNPERIFNMKFDVIIGNPPYQLETSKINKTQAIPIYHKFVEMAIQLNPNYIVMIIPSRWFAGGMGLDDFRSKMLNNGKIKYMVDYSNAKDCFPGVSIGGGVNYFLWDRSYNGDCFFTNIHNGTRMESVRKLNEYCVFIRYIEALNIINKIKKNNDSSLTDIISSLDPFKISSAERGHENKGVDDLVLYSSEGKSYISEKNVNDRFNLIKKYKIMVSKVASEHANEPDKNGQFKVLTTVKCLKPNEVCTFSYFIIGGFDNKKEALNLLTYLKSKFARFLLLQSITSINLTKDKFMFVPMEDFSKPWTDEELYKKYDLTSDEIAFIESMIKPMDLSIDKEDD